MTPKIPLPILVGPTGAGKTAVAIELCDLLNGEIISADSMQIYRGMDIGTAKATPEEQACAPHHLIDIINPDQEYSAARWANDARAAMAEIRRRGKQPIVVGGTGFYIAALLFPEHLASAPPDFQLRQELEDLVVREGSEVLHSRLSELDAAAGARLHPNDKPRLMRAIEVALFNARASTRGNGQATTPHLTSKEPKSSLRFVACGLSLPREELYARLNLRVDMMLAAGFLEELSHLVVSGYGDSAPLKNIGYKQMRPALSDATQKDAGIELWKRDTRRYAKRQMTWFRHQVPVQWFDAENQSARQLAEQIARCLSPDTEENLITGCENAQKMS